MDISNTVRPKNSGSRICRSNNSPDILTLTYQSQTFIRAFPSWAAEWEKKTTTNQRNKKEIVHCINTPLLNCCRCVAKTSSPLSLIFCVQKRTGFHRLNAMCFMFEEEKKTTHTHISLQIASVFYFDSWLRSALASWWLLNTTCPSCLSIQISYIIKSKTTQNLSKWNAFARTGSLATW